MGMRRRKDEPGSEVVLVRDPNYRNGEAEVGLECETG